MQSDEQGESERERQVDAIIAEYYRLSDAGGVADQNEFIQRNPDFASELKDFFADAQLLHSQDHSDPTENLFGSTIAIGTSRPAKPAAGSVVRYFGEYEILDKLGAGGMGVVYKARQTKLKRIVALKMIRSGELANSSDVQRFEAEAKAAAKLSHPGIVSVHEVGIHDGHHFYTMDYVEGGNLSQLHRDKPVPAKHAVKLVRQLAESMHYAHQKGIVHRDLKPANILLTAHGDPRITDFGLAKRVRVDDETQAPSMTESGQVLGTAGYMSPEQASGKSRLVGPSSDVYSLGAVLYALLTSRAPFVGETPSHTIMQVLQNEPLSPRKLNPSVPRDLETICLKCLEKDAYKRYGSAQLLADDLQRFLEGRSVFARPITRPARGWRWCRRNSILTALLALAVFAILSIPIVMFSQVSSAVNGVQDARGPALANLISQLYKYPSFAVTLILNYRFANESDSHRKRNLAFALAGYGELDADYLVSQIDAIADPDARNYVTALQANPATALTALKAEARKCTDKPLWRRKAKLAVAALGLGETEIAFDVCAFEKRPDPEQRTWFIEEFPRWVLDLKTVLAAVRNCDNPALRSGVCLGVGQIPVETISDTDKEAWQSLASQWFVEHTDTSTHSAAGWCLRHWKLPLPEIPNQDKISRQRDWFVNSVGSTMLRIRPESSTPAAVISDPIEKYRQQLLALKNIAAAELDRPQIRLERAMAYFQTGNLERALEGLTYLMEHDPSETLSTVLQYRTLTLARMGRANDSRQSLARYLERKVPASLKTQTEILVAAWLGDIPEASRQLQLACSDGFADQNMLYNLACAAALCAQATVGRGPNPSQPFANMAIELLERVVLRGYKKEMKARENPDFAILYGNARFATILAKMDEAVKQGEVQHEFWVGDREVTRGQFINDVKYAATEKPADWKGVNPRVSPTSEHPAQQVSWYDAVLYCNWLSLRDGFLPRYERIGTKERTSQIINGPEYDAWRQIPGANGYRMLDEAEWEYVCRAGTTTNYSSGDDESLLVGYCQMYPSKATALCGEKLPNAWGLHDAHGNVMEWCWDYISFGYKIEGLGRGWGRVLRGSCYSIVASNCQSGRRHADDPGNRAATSHFGFRLALSSPSGQLAESLFEGKPEEELAQALLSVGLEASPIAKSKLQDGGPDSVFEGQIKNAGGAIDEAGAFITSATLIELQEIQDRLKEKAYYIRSLRTSYEGNDLRFTACWRRKQATRLELELSESELVSAIQRMTFEGYRAIDIGGYLSDHSEGTDANYWGIWESATEANQEQIVRIGLDQDEHAKSYAKLHSDHAPITWQAFFDSQDQIRLCEIWEPTDKSKPQPWAILTLPPERMPEQFFALKQSQCQSVDMAQRKNSLGRMMSVLWRDVDEAADIKVLHSLPQDILVSAGRELLAQGFEPISMCVSGGVREHQQCAAVWRREKDELNANTNTASSTDFTPQKLDVVAQESQPIKTISSTPKMLFADAFQTNFDVKVGLEQRPMDVFIERDPTTSEPLYGIAWGPADGLEFIVHHRMSDDVLNQSEADAVRQGYKQKRIRTVTIGGVNHHIGLWTRPNTSTQK